MSLAPPRHHRIFVAVTQAQDVKLPHSLTMSAYNTGSSGFNMVVAIGTMMKECHGADLQVLPGGNGIARWHRPRARLRTDSAAAASAS